MAILKKISDQQLVDSYAQGNEKSLSELLNRHQASLIRFIKFYVNDIDVANDIFQETFFRFIKCVKTGKYLEKNKFNHYIFTIAKNLSFDYLNEKKKIPRNSFKGEHCVFKNLLLNQKSVIEPILKKEKITMLEFLFNQLPYKHQEILYLRLNRNLTFNEISKMKNLSINTSLAQFRYAIGKIQKLIKKYKLETALSPN